ncbi:MAG: PolC-type DNA polymerase III [Polyangiales bacterium]
MAQARLQVKGLCASFAADGDWQAFPWVVVDFETTGLDAQTHRVLEIGLVCFDAGELTARHDFLINPQMPVPEEARAVHGITDEELAQAPTFAELLPRITELVQGRLPVAYNASFDRGFLLAELARVGAVDAPAPAFDPEVQWIDPLVWVRELQKYEKGKKLTDVCARLGIPLDNAHRAASDAEATGKVLLKLAGKLPRTYRELVRIQTQYAAAQEAEFARWRARRGR